MTYAVEYEHIVAACFVCGDGLKPVWAVDNTVVRECSECGAVVAHEDMLRHPQFRLEWRDLA